MDRKELKKTRPAELLRLFSDVLEELRERKIIRSSNNPVADLAEILVSHALGLKLMTKSTKGHDAVDHKGQKYEIKARRPTKHNKSRQLSVLRGLNEKKFNYLAGIIFKDDFSVHRSCLIPHDIVLELADYRQYVNGWILHLRDSVWDEPGVIDITDKVFKAQREVNQL
jgi:hypothetical protein